MAFVAGGKLAKDGSITSLDPQRDRALQRQLSARHRPEQGGDEQEPERAASQRRKLQSEPGASGVHGACASFCCATTVSVPDSERPNTSGAYISPASAGVMMTFT